MVIPLLSGEEVRPCRTASDTDMAMVMAMDIRDLDMDLAIHSIVETI